MFSINKNTSLIKQTVYMILIKIKIMYKKFLRRFEGVKVSLLYFDHLGTNKYKGK